MSWITSIQADKFLSPNLAWDEFDNKDELLKLASNRLEQLTFKDEPIDRVGARYIDGSSVSKVAGSDDFLLEANKGNFAYHAELGWTRSVATMDLFTYTFGDDITNTFLVHDNDSSLYTFTQALTLKQIQSLHSFGGTFQGIIALDLDNGSAGTFTAIATNQGNAIVDSSGEQIFTQPKRRLNAAFTHNNTHVSLSSIEGTTGTVLDGVATVDVIDEQGDPQTNTVPEVLAGDLFSFTVKVLSTNGLNGTMFLYINDILVDNPTLHTTSSSFSRLEYQSGSGGGRNRVTYIKQFGAKINTENPITIPIRLVAACALLAFQYGKFPPDVVGENEDPENENNYNLMQDLPINVQAAVEPFLADYESVIVDGIATTDERGKVPVEITKSKMVDLEYK